MSLHVQDGRTSLTLVTEEYEADAVVAMRHRVADGVVALTLRHAAGQPFPEWTPGAHIDLILSDGTVRQYSLCGPADDPLIWRIGVLREEDGRGGSARVHDELMPGSHVRVRGPRNHFGLESAPRYLFIAGGIGITPLLPMIAAADATGADWKLLYGGRSRSRMAFLDELADYEDRVAICPQDEFGLLDLPALLGTPRPGTLVYCCGPEPLLAAAEELCAAWPADALRVERFTSKPMDEPVLNEAFEVRLAQSGLTLPVPPGKSILRVLEEAGFDALSSCEEGVCGTCETNVLDGEPDHRDSILTDQERAENTCMMICVSRSLRPLLVLDL